MTELNLAVRRSSVWMVAKMGISVTIGAFVTTYVIRGLSLRDFGIYNILYSVIGYVSVFATFGIPSVMGRYLPEALQKKDYSLIRALVVRGLRLRMLFSVSTVGLIFILHGPIGRLLMIEDFLKYFSILSVSIILALESGLMTSVLHSLFLHKYSVIAGTFYTLLRGGSVFLALQMQWGIKGVLIAELISWGGWVALLWLFYYSQFSRLHPAKAHASVSIRRYVRYGGYATFSRIGGTVLGASTDYFVITAFLGPGAVAYYAFGDRVIRLLSNCLPHEILSEVITPSFITKYCQNGDKSVLSDMFNFILKIAAFSIFPLVAGIFVLGDKIITIVFKPEYLQAEPILLILAGLMIVDIVNRPAHLVLQALEQIKYNLYSKMFAVYNLLVELVVVQYYGVIGVVLVTTSANLMCSWYLYYYARKFAGLHIDFKGLFSILTNSLLMAAVVWLLRPFVIGFVSLGLIIIVGASAYLLFSWVNKAFKAYEREWVNRVSPWPVFVF